MTHSLFDQALEKGADTLVTVGAAQSNHCRQTAAAAAKVGLRCALVLSGHPPPRPWTGNLLLHVLLGAELHWAGNMDRSEAAATVVEALRAGGAVDCWGYDDAGRRGRRQQRLGLGIVGIALQQRDRNLAHIGAVRFTE